MTAIVMVVCVVHAFFGVVVVVVVVHRTILRILTALAVGVFAVWPMYMTGLL